MIDLTFLRSVATLLFVCFLGYDALGFEFSKPYLRADLENDLKLWVEILCNIIVEILCNIRIGHHHYLVNLLQTLKILYWSLIVYKFVFSYITIIYCILAIDYTFLLIVKSLVGFLVADDRKQVNKLTIIGCFYIYIP